ncbi:MAG: hypothetical protein RLZZ546_2597 [Bacteroidota bacterium]|jgi:hypothetical protein
MNNEIENTEKKKIKISGTYGDKVKLYLDGYVSTKYGEFLKVKSVDQENSYVYLYGCGDDGLGYSRISSSCKVSEDTNKDYLNSLEYMFKRLKLKEESIIKFKFSENAPVETFKILKITYPSLTEMDFVPKLTLENLQDYEKVEITLNDFDDFQRINLVSVEFTPYTLEEKLYNLLSESSDYNGAIKDKDKYINNLLEIIKNERVG